MADIKLYEHPDYVAQFKDWQLYKRLYEGQHDEVSRSDILWPHDIELRKDGAGLLNARKQRTQYINMLAFIIRSYVAIALRNEIDTKNVREVFGKEGVELDNVDGKGTSFETFVKKHIANPYFLYGKAAVHVDSYGIEASSLKEEQELGIRAYMNPLNPLQLVDWGYETAVPKYLNKPTFIRYEETRIEPRTFDQAPVQRLHSTVYRANYGTSAAISSQGFIGPKYERNKLASQESKEWTPEAEQALQYSMIPVAILEGESWAKRLVPIVMLRHNTQSALDNNLLFQAHRQIFITGAFTKTEAKEIAFHEGIVTFLTEGEAVTALDPADTSSLERREDRLTRYLIQVAYSQTRNLSAESRETESADAQREQKEAFLEDMTQAAKDIEGMINQCVQIYADVKGMGDYTGAIKLDTDLTIEDVDQFIRMLSAMADQISRVPSWQRGVNAKMAGRMNLQNKDEIMADLEADEGIPQPADIAAGRRNLFAKAISGDAEE
jgi:hypothetical protein